MSASHQCLSIAGAQIGDLISVGQRVKFFTVRKDLSDLDGRIFESIDVAITSITAIVRKLGTANDRPAALMA